MFFISCSYYSEAFSEASKLIGLGQLKVKYGFLTEEIGRYQILRFKLFHNLNALLRESILRKCSLLHSW